MGGKSASITVRILGDNKDVKGSVNETEATFKGFGSKMAGFAAGAGAAIGTFAISAGRNLVSAAGDWINLAKQADVFGKKADVVFGDSASGVKAWADGINESLGLSDEAVVGLAASMGDLLVPLGFSREAAAGMSEQMIDLSGALSAWSGGTVDAAQVSDIMTKAMLGETDGLKALGISISADEVARKAATMAAEGQTFATEAQANAAATQALILEKSTDAQKAWADGTMDSVKQQNEATAAWEDAKVQLGKGLMPIVQAATTWFVGSFLPAARNVAAEFRERWPEIKQTALEVFGAVQAYWAQYGQPVLDALIAGGAAVVGWVVTNWPQISQTISDVLTTVGTIVQGAIDFVTMIWTNFGEQITTFIQGKFDAIRQVIEGALQVVQGIVHTITSLIHGDWSGVWEGIRQVFSGVWDMIVGAARDFLNTLKFIIDVGMELIRAAWDKAWSTITGLVSSAIDSVVSFVTGLPGRLAGYASSLFDGVKSGISTAWDDIKTDVETKIGLVVDAVTGIPGRLLEFVGDFTDAGLDIGGAVIDGIGDAFGAAIDGAADLGKKFANGVIGGINTVIDKVNSLLEIHINVPFGPDIDIDPPDIPHVPKFHTGGVVPGPIGSEQLAMLQAGEGVFTREQMAALGGGGAGVHIENLNVTNDRSIADELRLVEALYGQAA